ncbi:MAG: hypothetical protein HY730_10050 [Candidatus Tectomicrobia bacterium]|uniref:Uncharacterized protein n=1 Tax=Tectimicrobiota bacterium TaxID=2528274 RepID=A0A933GNJ3_UNCTE|nr:hypothetical protein [Candidatus Tectomicrobia bacterium]
MKSAIELAMERSKRMSGGEEPSLSEEQKKEISEIRTKYKAKIAEAEILLQEEEPRVKEITKLQEECEARIQEVYRKALKSKN